MKILVTGSAGFIGNAVSLQLLRQGYEVIGIDNLNAYYDVSLKKSRLSRIKDYDGFTEVCADLRDKKAIADTFNQFEPQQVVNLAAQPGVRYSTEHPDASVESNIVGFLNILEGCRRNRIEHLVYPSSSSVYGANHVLLFGRAA